jgi:hypothetical protein
LSPELLDENPRLGGDFSIQRVAARTLRQGRAARDGRLVRSFTYQKSLLRSRRLHASFTLIGNHAGCHLGRYQSHWAHVACCGSRNFYYTRKV